jgi:hypothetical protein
MPDAIVDARHTTMKSISAACALIIMKVMTQLKFFVILF